MATASPKPSGVSLRDVTKADLPIFFEQQLDSQANYMAAFTAKGSTDRKAFDAHWAKILADDSIMMKTILFQGHVAGSILCHAWFGEPEIGFWLGKEYWGKGITTQALTAFLGHLKTRPLYARAAKDNTSSIRVLQKCGFAITGEDKGFSNARGEEVEEFILELNRQPD